MIYIGTSGWHYADWAGKFYPIKLPKSVWLSYYAEHFNTVEINATFYRKFNDSAYKKWAAQVPAKFKFIIKAPRVITHMRPLNNISEVIDQFCRSALLLGDKLAMVLLQLPATYPYDLSMLANIVQAFSPEVPLAIEFRHTAWQTKEAQDFLRLHRYITCCPDSPQTSLIDWLTTDIGYIRLHGKTQWFDYVYTNIQLDEVKSIGHKMLTQGAKDIFILFNNTMKASGIFNAKTLQKQLLKPEELTNVARIEDTIFRYL